LGSKKGGGQEGGGRESLLEGRTVANKGLGEGYSHFRSEGGSLGKDLGGVRERGTIAAD